MSYQTYKTGQGIAAQDYPFYALIQAAMRQADTENTEKLRQVFPRVWNELQSRYNAPGGFLFGDPELEQLGQEERAELARTVVMPTEQVNEETIECRRCGEPTPVDEIDDEKGLCGECRHNDRIDARWNE